MASNNYITKINNKRIFEFYKTHPDINIETMNLILLDLLENIGNDMNNLISNKVCDEILENVKFVKEHVTSFNDNLTIKFHEHNKSFLDATKMIIGMSSNESTEKIINLLNKNTDSFIDKINTTLPQSQDNLSSKIQEKISSLNKEINSTIKEFISKNNPESSSKDLLSSLDSKIASIQQPLFNFISNNHEQVTTKLSTIHEQSSCNKSLNDKLMNDLNDFLSKYKSSSQFKGQCSENMLETTLNQMLPTASITNTTALKASGDFIIKRDDKSDILIENKNYEANVNLEEIKKFIRDINEQKTHGIMMSQYSGIASKPNGFIEINDGKVLIYLHYVEYSKERIKMAIDIIDNLSDKLAEIKSFEENDGIIIKKNVLDSINEEFQKFIIQKETALSTLKEFNKKLCIQIEDMKMPDLSSYLNDKYASIQNQQFICDVCNMGFTNKRSLASHKKIHKKPKNDASEIIEVNT